MKLCESASLRAGDPVHFRLTLGERDAICLRCPLAECLEVTSVNCPIRIEQRRRWRADYYRRVGSRPRRKYTRKTEKAGKEKINA